MTTSDEKRQLFREAWRDYYKHCDKIRCQICARFMYPVERDGVWWCFYCGSKQ